MNSHSQSRCCSRLLAATVLLGGSLTWLIPALAAGTAAGTNISNTATATYSDPNNPGTPIEAISNTVTVEVAEVAGVTLVDNGFTFVDGGNGGNQANTIDTNDVVTFDFLGTNTGNDATEIFVPVNPSSVTGGTLGAIDIDVDLDGDGNFGDITVADIANIPTGSLPAGVTEVLDGGGNRIGLLIDNVAADGQINISVPVTVTANTSGAPVGVVFGDTTPDGGQSVPTDTGDNDFRTVDDDNTADGGNQNDASNTTLPVNGEQEAEASQQITAGGSVNEVALARVFKDFDSSDSGTDPNDLADDSITYNLSLDVVNPSTDPTITAGDLTGIDVADLSATTQTNFSSLLGNSYIFVTDAIPANTDLDITSNVPVAPTGWTVVVTTTATTTDATQADWQTLADFGTSNPETITRIGFVLPIGGTSGNTALQAGEPTITGFQLTVDVEDTVTGTSIDIVNVAQVFGETDGIVGGPVIFDESGDQLPNNFDDNGTTPAANPINDGVANTNQGIDPGNNGGAGEDGEVLVVSLFAGNAPSGLFIGTNDGTTAIPDAVGPTDTNDDFTNRALDPVALDTDNDGAIDSTASTTFINSLRATPNDLTDVLVRPIINNLPGSLDTLNLAPIGTQVNITFNGQTATYDLLADDPTTAAANDSAYVFDNNTTPIAIPVLGPTTGDLDIQVEVILPAGTATTDGQTGPNFGYAVPIVAFADDNNNGRFDGLATDPTSNLTIDRVYLGYVTLEKTAQILDSNGNTIAGENPSSSTIASSQNTIPGNIIEYAITYSNISEAAPAAGFGNIILEADNLVIVEDGTDPSGNNWATGNPVFTLNVPGSASDTNPSSITYTTSSNTTVTSDPGTDVVRYEDALSAPLLPTESGTFTFQRRINEGL
ncbi:hypothetical protein [Synechococcus sp. PCC 7336]|uniref:beta strand repeat-containing protein n=1 Tax=Synechococcus sp. PCC 7336 TaxID=195250 RepID=UPI0003466545|nr:hypothetical protein [Synechococcus sp. PCC 7336]